MKSVNCLLTLLRMNFLGYFWPEKFERKNMYYYATSPKACMVQVQNQI